MAENILITNQSYPDDVKSVDEMAKKENRSIANMAVMLIREALDNRQSTNSGHGCQVKSG